MTYDGCSTTNSPSSCPAFPITDLLFSGGVDGSMEGTVVSGCGLERMSIFSSFSSKETFNSFASVSKTRTRSSSDSVYPLGKALRLSLSLVLHSKPTLAHWVQQGLMPSQRIFLLRHRSQAWAILLWTPVASLITLMGSVGSMPGMAIIYANAQQTSAAKERRGLSKKMTKVFI